ncbi:hypothetical protein RhiirA1_542648 [Rhizophagus irregularis]|uniref:RNase H type-1 domain-containing protein n=1 Tax=Rhizophagus irregularis TaxID=588596 RepID=A0A2N0QVK1_9GLOM|nr:hypothetical protein RhiirA1_542648 [Rhizophagus irregularis]
MAIYEALAQAESANVEIYSDSQWVVNTFDDLNFLTIKDIERSKVNYKVLWLCLFKIIRIYSLKVKITKVKAHSDCDYNKEADKLAKSGAEKNVLIIEDKLLLHNGTVCWRDMPIEHNPILMIKGIKDAQFIEEFLMLHRNEVYRQSDLLRLIDWKISLKLNNINQYDILFEDHYLQSFRIKICCNELPTCANLKKRKPDLYDENWRCNFCKIEEETFDHFWKCSKIQNVMQDILISVLGFGLVQLEYSRDDIDIQELKGKINELELLRCYKITEEKLLYKVLKQITGRVLLEFKVLIWEPRNELQIKEEKWCGISGKDKKAKSHSKRTEVGVKNVSCNMLKSNWNKWNDLAFHRGDHWANF